MDKAEIEKIRTLQALMREGRRRAKEKGLAFTLKLKDLHIPDECPVLRVKMERNKGHVNTNSPTLDRIDSTLGYIPGNVRVISWRANNLKSNLTLEQLERMVAYVKGEV